MNEMTGMTTRSQEYAQRAFGRIQERERSLEGVARKEFSSFAKRFPSLVHSCGLAQALAFAKAKAPKGYLDDVAAVIEADSVSALCEEARSAPLPHYMRLSRDTIRATGWLKRSCEGLFENEDDQGGGDHASMS